MRDLTGQKRVADALRDNEARQEFLIKLGDAIRPLYDSVEVQGVAARVLGEQLNVDRAYYVEIDEANREFVVARHWHRSEVPSHAQRYPLGDWSMPWLGNGATWVGCARYRHRLGDARRPARIVSWQQYSRLRRRATDQEWTFGGNTGRQPKHFPCVDAPRDRPCRRRGKGFLTDSETPSPSWLERYIPDSDKPLVQPRIAEAIRAKNTFELEHRVLRADGTVGWTFSRAIPLLDKRGEIVEWFGTASDITPRKQAEERVLASEEKYRTLFESIDEGFCTIEVIFDENGKASDYRFLDLNPAFERQTGLKNAVGMTMRQLHPQHEEFWFET